MRKYLIVILTWNIDKSSRQDQSRNVMCATKKRTDRACFVDITCRTTTSFTTLPWMALRGGYRRVVNHTLNLLEPSPPVCRGVYLNRNDSRASEREWNRRKKTRGREREKVRKGREGGRGSNWHRNAKYHCPLYIQEHNLTKLLAHSDLLPSRSTGSFLIHVSNDVTRRPPSPPSPRTL